MHPIFFQKKVGSSVLPRSRRISGVSKI